jgi:mRNA interferase MazF
MAHGQSQDTGQRRQQEAKLPAIPSIVPLGPADHPLVGKILCDDVIEVYDEDVAQDSGAVTPATMRKVEDGLREAFGL